MKLLQGLGSVLVGILTVKSSYDLFNYSDIPPSLDTTLSIYKDCRVFYRAGDNSTKNLEPTFVAISKRNQCIVSQTPPTHHIINGKINGVMTLL